MQNENHSIIYEELLPKMLSLSLIKPIEITSSFQETKQIGEQIKTQGNNQTNPKQAALQVNWHPYS